MLSLERSQLEFFKFVRIYSRTSTDSNNLINDIHCGDSNDAFLGFLNGIKGVVPRPCFDGKSWAEIHYHGPEDGHDVVSLTIICRNEDYRSRLNQGKGFTDW